MSTMTKTRTGTARRVLLGTLAALSLMAALATPAAAAGKMGGASGFDRAAVTGSTLSTSMDGVTVTGGKLGVGTGEGLTTAGGKLGGGMDDAALPAEQISLNKATPKLLLAAIGEEIPTRHPSGVSGSIVIPQ